MAQPPALGADEKLVMTIPQTLWYIGGAGIALGALLVITSGGEPIILVVGLAIVAASALWAGGTSYHLTDKRLILKTLRGSKSLNLDQVNDVQRHGVSIIVRGSRRSARMQLLLVKNPDDVVAAISNQLRRTTVTIQGDASPVAALKMRYARGEIPKDEYEEKLRALQ